MAEKPTKKQGKSKLQSEDGPEFKKPIDPKRVLQILQCQRMIRDFVESMLEPDIKTEQLSVGEKFICQHDYDSIVQERYILRLCGYPLCQNTLTREWKQRYHISLRDKRIYDVEIRKLYCSVRCMDNSTNYRNEKIPEQPIWMRLEDIIIGPNFEIQKSNP